MITTPRKKNCQRGWNWRMTGCKSRWPRNDSADLMTQNSFTRGKCQALCLGWFAAVSLASLPAADSGSSVLVLYNSRVPESKEVAEYYAQKRAVPASQVLGLDLPATEAMTRSEYLEQLQNPLLKNLETNKLFVFAPAAYPGDEPLRKL